MTGRCPWHGSPCDCDGELDPAIDPHRGRFAKWQAINGRAPPYCEDRIPLDMVPMYLRPQQVSDAKVAAYQEWIKSGMRAGDEGETDPSS